MQPTERQLADFAQGIRQNDVYEQMRLLHATHSTRDESGQNIAARGTASPPQEISASLPIAPIGSACGILIVNQLRP